jgi:hypothetical protein
MSLATGINNVHGSCYAIPFGFLPYEIDEEFRISRDSFAVFLACSRALPHGLHLQKPKIKFSHLA